MTLVVLWAGGGFVPAAVVAEQGALVTTATIVSTTMSTMRTASRPASC